MEHYHTQHSPFGAFASFTCGLPGKPGGFGQGLCGPANQNLFVAHRRDGAEWLELPLLGEEAASGAIAYLGETPDAFEPVRRRRLNIGTEAVRELAWSSDTWKAGNFRFALHSPWDRTEDPGAMDAEQARFAFAPLVCGEIGYDNSGGTEPVELFFGIHNPERPWRPLGDVQPGLCGFACGDRHGFATLPGQATLHQGFDPYQMRLGDHRGLHLLGQIAGLRFSVPAGCAVTFPLVLGFFQGGVATTGIRTRYYYTRLFRDLEEVLMHGLRNHGRYLELSAKRDAELMNSRLDAHQRWIVAQATHSYLGSTQLLTEGEGRKARPLWVVNEGEYRMLNTFDLTVDHLFFELEWHPWAVRNALDLFVERYSYTDTIHTLDGGRAEGGLSFTHDMGIADQFTPAGRSSYECTGLQGCFSHMTLEQLINWICCACVYAERTGDDAWLARRKRVLADCAESLLRREDPEPAKRDGLLKWDSDRCGPQGAEITTYDSLDVSLGQSRRNLYIQSKALAAWLLLERAWQRLGRNRAAKTAGKSADRVARAILSQFEASTGFFPAVFENGNRSRILPAVEGLVFPLYLGWGNEVRERFPELFRAYSRHLSNSLQPGICLDAESGAWKISSTSVNTWYSKIAIAQHVVRCLFPESLNPAARAADAVHARFQRSEPLGRFAMVDQVRSHDGADLGSRYYPRIVTACLWLRE